MQTKKKTLYKLPTAAAFQRVFMHQTHKSHQKHLLLLATPSTQPQAQLGLAIAKKHCKKAVDRNRIKRIIRENFRIQNLPAQDIVFISKPGIAHSSNAQLKMMVGNLLATLA